MSKPVILLVDDEQDLLQVLTTAVSRALPAYDVVGYGSIGEAVDCLADLDARGTPLALAVVDHVVGGHGLDRDTPETGVDLLECIRGRYPEVPTFLYTGQAPAPVEARARATGARVLWKPARLKALLGDISQALAS